MAGVGRGTGFLGGTGAGTVVGAADAAGTFVVRSGILGTAVLRGIGSEELVVAVVPVAVVLALERGCFPFPCEDMGGVAV